MNNQREVEQARLERAFESIGEGEERYELVLYPATGELRAVDNRADEDRMPATQMAREGFF